jgi:hypothetical protein
MAQMRAVVTGRRGGTLKQLRLLLQHVLLAGVWGSSVACTACVACGHALVLQGCQHDMFIR